MNLGVDVCGAGSRHNAYGLAHDSGSWGLARLALQNAVHSVFNENSLVFNCLPFRRRAVQRQVFLTFVIVLQETTRWVPLYSE